MEFNEKLFRARKDKGLSQEALAERIGVSRQAVSKWETGEAKPDTDKLCALCTVLELSMDELLLGRKQAEIAPKRPKKSMKWLILILSAVLIFALGVLAGRVRFPMETVNSVAFEPEIRAQDIEIADVLIERRLGEKNIWEWHMAVMPENPAEGLIVRFLLENEFGVKTASVRAEENGAYFTADYPCAKDGDATIILEMVLGGGLKRVPLRRYDYSHDGFYRVEELWKK